MGEGGVGGRDDQVVGGVVAPDGQPQITVVKVTVEPGKILPMHTHPCINAAYMVSGEATVVTKDGRKKTVKAGEAFIELVDVWHYGHNHGTEPAEIVVFYAGTPGTALAVKEDTGEAP